MSLIELLLATTPSQIPPESYGGHTPSITNDSYNHGGDIPTNPQADGIYSPANKKSIHSNGTIDSSYSLNGTNAQGAQNIYNSYNLAPNLLGLASNNIPAPSIIDLNGEKPSSLYFTTNRSNTDFD